MTVTYLCHHGVKGQKWGVRRYQKSDGTLTDEGRRQYGYGRTRGQFIRPNTRKRISGGAKLGAKVGAVSGGILGGIGASIAASLIMPYYGIPSAVASAGLTFVTNVAARTASGTLWGAGIGAIAGAVETHNGRRYVERYDTGLEDFERRDRNG